MSVKILIGGMQGAGKSTLACSVYTALLCRGVDVSLHELDVWSDTHDCILGRKPWSQRNGRGSEVVNDLADEFAEAIERFNADQHDIVIGDLHGRTQMPTREYWSGLRADHAFMVIKYRQSVYLQFRDQNDWRRLFDELGCPDPVRIHSLREDQTEPLRGAFPITDLNRALVPFNPQIISLANSIQELRSKVMV